jgi:hypothetical protein
LVQNEIDILLFDLFNNLFYFIGIGQEAQLTTVAKMLSVSIVLRLQNFVANYIYKLQDIAITWHCQCHMGRLPLIYHIPIS